MTYDDQSKLSRKIELIEEERKETQAQKHAFALRFIHYLDLSFQWRLIPCAFFLG